MTFTIPIEPNSSLVNREQSKDMKVLVADLKRMEHLLCYISSGLPEYASVVAQYLTAQEFFESKFLAANRTGSILQRRECPPRWLSLAIGLCTIPVQCAGTSSAYLAGESPATEAERFYKVLQNRLEKFGLKLHTDKSQINPAGRVVALRANQSRKRLPTFNFLGFSCYCGRSRKGFWRLQFSGSKDRFAAKLKGLRGFLRKNLFINLSQRTHH